MINRRQATAVIAVGGLAVAGAAATLAAIVHDANRSDEPPATAKLETRARKRIYRWEGTGYGWPSPAWMQRRMFELKTGDLIAFIEDDLMFYGRVQQTPKRCDAPREWDWETVILPIPEEELPPGVVPCR